MSGLLRKIHLFLTVQWYLSLLTAYHILLPNEFVRSERKVHKKSVWFKIYEEVLKSYTALLDSGRRRGSDFLFALQEQRLRRIVRIVSKIPWWREYFRKHNLRFRSITQTNELTKLPPINRSHVAHVPPTDLMTQRRIRKNEVQVNRTSGSTTGTPFAVPFHRSVSVLDVTAHYLRILEDYGFSFSENSQKDFFFHFNLFGGIKVLTTAPEQFSNGFAVRRGENTDQKIASMVASMEKVGSCILFTHPSELPLLVQKFEELHVHPPIKVCLVIGQVLEKSLREQTEKRLGCPIVSVYGFREQMILASSCKNNPELMHVHQERAIIEILDDAGKRVPNGAFGNVTVTGFENFLMPLLRYQPGDVGRLRTDIHCSCINATPLLEIDSRAVDVFTFADGTTKSVKSFMSVFTLEPFFSQIQRVQVRQENLRLARIFLEARKKPLSKDIVRLLGERIARRHFFPPDFQVALEEVEKIDIGNSKYNPFVPYRIQKNKGA